MPMNRFGAVLVAVGLSGAFATAASPDPKDLAIPPQELSRARELVRRLGSEDYKDRETAQAELAKMGRLARPALADAAAVDPSPEVRSRAARLLPRAEAEELKARIDTFLADADNKFDHDLPAWKSFRRVVGPEKSTRDLYVELIRTPNNLELMLALGALGDDPDLADDTRKGEAGKAIADRRMAIYLRMYPHAFGGVRVGTKTVAPIPPTVADIACLLFGEIVVDGKFVPQSAFFMQVSAAMFLQQGGALVNAANGNGGPYDAAFKKLLSRWFDTRTHPSDLSNYALINVANNFKQFPETTPLLRRVVTTDGVVGYQKSQALMYLIQRNQKQENEFLRTLVIGDAEKDAGGGDAAVAVSGGPGSVAGQVALTRRHGMVTTVVQQVWLGNNQNSACQLRDYALALLIVQNGQQIRDYGFDFPPGGGNQNQIGYPNYAFANEEKRSAEDKREAAIKKWREWEDAQAASGKTKPNPFRRIP